MVIVIILMATVLKVWVTQTFITEMYEARAAIVVPLDRNPAGQAASEIQILRSRQLLGDVVDVVGAQAFNSPAGNAERLFDQVQLSVRRGTARFHDFYNEVLIALDLKQSLSDRDRALANLESQLEVESQQNTNVIVLRLRMPDAALAIKVQETLLERYQARRVQVHQPSRSAASTERETERLRESLARAEEDLTRAQQAAALAGHATNGADASASLLAELDERRRRVEQNYVAALKRHKAATAEHTLDVRPITVLAAPAASLDPVYPRKLLLMVIAVMAGLLLGFTTAALREWMSDPVRDGSSLELATGVVCFGSFTDRRTIGERL